MRISPKIVLIALALLPSAIQAEPTPDNKFTPVVPMYDYKRVDAVISTVGGIPHHETLTMGTPRPVTLLDPAKAKLVRDGITLKELVDALGPGYKEYWDGTYQWLFADARTLSVKPAKLEEGEVLFFLNDKSKSLDDTMQWDGPQADKKAFTPFIVLDDYFYFRVKRLDAGKAALVREGMTLKELVDALGPGYMPQNAGVGTITWFFSGDRALNVLPSTYKESDVLSFNGMNEKRMWWDPKP